MIRPPPISTLFPYRRSSDLCTSISPLSFLNSSIGTYASDLRPALTTTKLCSMRTTSAVMTSPARISERCSDSRSREHTSELQSQSDLVCRLLLEKKKQYNRN